MKKVRLLLPTAQGRPETRPLSPRPSGLETVTVGFLWNTKPNGDLLFEEFVNSEGSRIGAVKTYRKALSSQKAGDHILDRMASECGAAVVAVGD